MSQKALADFAGYSLSYVQKVESGSRPVDSLQAIARFAQALEATPGELLGGSIQLTAQGPQPAAETEHGSIEAVELARKVGASAVSTGVLDAVDAMVDRLCRDYSSTPPTLLLGRVRSRLRYVSGLLDSRMTLAQRRRLLAAGGWLSVLLAIVQFDAGQREAAEANRAAAFQLGREIGHRQLMAWAVETKAWFAVFERRFRAAADLARAGLDLAPPGTSAAVQLAVQHARAWAAMRDQGETATCLARAEAELARLTLPEHPEHHFAFDEPKLAYYQATCNAWLGDGVHAEEFARQVIATGATDPAGAGQCTTRLMTAHVDLGLALFLQGRVDEACAVAGRAFEGPCLRSSTLWRARELDALLIPKHADLPEARDWHERYTLARRSLRSA